METLVPLKLNILLRFASSILLMELVSLREDIKRSRDKF